MNNTGTQAHRASKTNVATHNFRSEISTLSSRACIQIVFSLCDVHVSWTYITWCLVISLKDGSGRVSRAFCNDRVPQPRSSDRHVSADRVSGDNHVSMVRADVKIMYEYVRTRDGIRGVRSTMRLQPRLSEDNDSGACKQFFSLTSHALGFAIFTRFCEADFASFFLFTRIVDLVLFDG